MSEEKVYITIKGRAEARFEEKKSVFIGYSCHVESEEEALAFIKEIKGETTIAVPFISKAGSW